jgi:hypothetical protein
LCSLSFIDLCLLITPLVSSNFWSLRCLSFINFCLLINPLVSSNLDEGQTTQWPKIEDTKGVIRRHKSMKDREHNGQKFEDNKEVIRRH